MRKLNFLCSRAAGHRRPLTHAHGALATEFWAAQAATGWDTGCVVFLADDLGVGLPAAGCVIYRRSGIPRDRERAGPGRGGAGLRTGAGNQRLSDWSVRMQLVISPIEDSDGEALASLYQWLSGDAEVSRHGRLSAEAVRHQPGDMGVAIDVINAVFADTSAAAAIGSLLVAYRAWRDTRTHAPAIKIEKDGVTVLVDRRSDNEIRQILESLLQGAGPATDTGKTGEDPEEHR